MTELPVSIHDGGDLLALIAQLSDIARDHDEDTRPTFPLELANPRGFHTKVTVPVRLGHVGIVTHNDPHRPQAWLIAGTIAQSAMDDDEWLKPYEYFCAVYSPMLKWKVKGYLIPNPSMNFLTVDASELTMWF